MSSQLKVDNRGQLYYNKYKYRARLFLFGLNRAYGVNTITKYMTNIERFKSYYVNSTSVSGKIKELDLINYTAMEKFFEWKALNQGDSMIRIESNVAGIFSNDLALLKTLEDIDPGSIKEIDYTQVNPGIPDGTRYFNKEPKHKFRIYFKCKMIPLALHQNIADFVKRYENTTTIISPSVATLRWLIGKSKYNVVSRYSTGSHYLEYDEESTFTLISLFCGDLLGRRFKLEKRPEAI